MLKVWNTYLYEWLISMVNVGKYTMEHLGHLQRFVYLVMFLRIRSHWDINHHEKPIIWGIGEYVFLFPSILAKTIVVFVSERSG